MKTDRIGEWTRDWAEKSNLHTDYYFECTSTNDLAKMFDYKTVDPILFVTENQTKGRGRHTNTWFSPSSGAGLLGTFSFGVDALPQPITTPLIGLAVYKALNATFEIKNLALKAPNDIYIGNSKVGGILVEVLSEGSQHRLIIGLGLNVFAKPNLAKTASLVESTGNIDQEKWFSFLNNLFVELTQALPSCMEPEISHHVCNELLEALNHYTELKEKYTAVEPEGSLRTKTKLVSWTEL